MKIPVDTVPVGRVCYISVGLVIHADERQAHGTFVAEDLVVSVKDQQHPKPYIEGKDIVRWGFDRIRYLEYGTSRAPALFRRKTFEALYDVAEKLVSMDLAGAQTRGGI